MTDEERQKLAKSLDDDLDNFIGGLSKSTYKDGWKPETWEEEMQKHPFFRNKPLEDGEELPPLIQGLQELKYDSTMHNDEELAATFKEDGNLCFKVKKYRHAVDNYTEALRKRHPNTELITQLLTNRAAAHYHLGNYRSSLRDCERAVALTPGHMKAILRGVHCCARLTRHCGALEWCDRGLALDPLHSELVKLRNTATAAQRVEERDRRQAALKERREAAADASLLAALHQSNVRLMTADGAAAAGDAMRVELLTPQLPGVEARVHLTSDGALCWPIVFLYPEHGQSDLVQAALETDLLSDHLAVMFGADAPPSEWDPQRRYTADRLQLYYEEAGQARLVSVPAQTQLRSVLADPRYVVKGGVPGFLVLLRDSDFHREFLARYTVLNGCR